MTEHRKLLPGELEELLNSNRLYAEEKMIVDLHLRYSGEHSTELIKAENEIEVFKSLKNAHFGAILRAEIQAKDLKINNHSR